MVFKFVSLGWRPYKSSQLLSSVNCYEKTSFGARLQLIQSMIQVVIK